MSVSVPNLTSNAPPRSQDIPMQKPLAETYAPYQKHRNFDRNNSHNNQSQVSNHMPQRVPTSVSSLVRLALSTNFPSKLLWFIYVSFYSLSIKPIVFKKSKKIIMLFKPLSV